MTEGGSEGVCRVGPIESRHVRLPRAIMYAARNPHRNRGHRYLHSTFCDLVIGVLGVRPQPDRTLHVRPLVPAARIGLRHFAVDGLRILGRDVGVAYDASGSRYGLGPGLHVLVDGDVVATGRLGERLVVPLSRQS